MALVCSEMERAKLFERSLSSFWAEIYSHLTLRLKEEARPPYAHRDFEPKVLKIRMRVSRSRLLFQSPSEVGLYFAPESRKCALKNLCCANFTANYGHQELVESPWDYKIFPKFGQIEPKLVKITTRVRGLGYSLSR